MRLDKRSQLIQNLCNLLIECKESEKPLIVGINGIDTSGKSQLTAELEILLKKMNISVQTIHVDDFHNPKSIRYVKGMPEDEQFYKMSIDFKRLVREVLQPIKENGRLYTTLTLLDLISDTWTLKRNYEIDRQTIVLVEGVFLFREETQGFIDFPVYLKISEDEAMRRGRLRDVPTQGDEVMLKYISKYLPAQRKYIKEFEPDTFAKVVIDNSQWENPQVKVWPI